MPAAEHHVQQDLLTWASQNANAQGIVWFGDSLHLASKLNLTPKQTTRALTNLQRRGRIEKALTPDQAAYASDPEHDGTHMGWRGFKIVTPTAPRVPVVTEVPDTSEEILIAYAASLRRIADAIDDILTRPSQDTQELARLRDVERRFLAIQNAIGGGK